MNLGTHIGQGVAEWVASRPGIYGIPKVSASSNFMIFDDQLSTANPLIASVPSVVTKAHIVGPSVLPAHVSHDTMG